MRTRLLRRYVFGGLLVATTVLVVGAAASDSGRSAGAAGWQGLLGSRPVPQLGDRWIVVLDAPSLAGRVRRADGTATEARMKAWTRAAREAQDEILTQLAFRGAPI